MHTVTNGTPPVLTVWLDELGRMFIDLDKGRERVRRRDVTKWIADWSREVANRSAA